MCFSPFKDAEIDLTVLGVKGEIEKEDFDKRQNEQKQKSVQTPVSYQNPLVKRDNEDDAW